MALPGQRCRQPSQSIYGIAGRLLAAFAVAVFASQLLHLFKPGYFDARSDQSVLPPQWHKWGNNALATGSQSTLGEIGAGILGANFISPTLLLAVVAVLMILAT